jgi:PAS domain S-box-containing protein
VSPSDGAAGLYRALVETLEEGFVFHDGDGRVVFSNPAASRILGISADQLAGRSAFDPAWNACFEDGSRDPDRHPSVVVRRTGGPVSNVVMRVAHPAGRVVWVSVSARPVFDAGDLTGVVVSFRDITEQRSTQRALRDNVERFRLLFETTADAVSFFDLDTLRLLDFNDSLVRMFGYEPGELRRMTLIDLSAEPDKTRMIVRSLVAGRSFRIPTRMQRRRDGTVFPVAISTGAFELEGAVVGYAIARDMSERQAAETARRQAELNRVRAEAAIERSRLVSQLARSERLESLGRLAGGIAHDFNNLLGVILNYAGFVKKQVPPDSAIAGDIEEIRRAGQRAADLTRQLLLFGRREIVRPEVFDLSSVIESAMPLFRRTLAGVHVELDLSRGPVPVRADRGQLEQVLANLLINARDAIQARDTVRIRGTIVVTTAMRSADRNGPAMVDLLVTDDGAGMTAEVLAQAFEPFFTTKGRDRGSGLGLSSVHGIVAGAGGEVSIESEPGAGTTVRVSLPAATPEVVEHLDTGVAPDGDTVLLVDDEPEVRAMTARILREHGYRVVEARSGEEALARAGHEGSEAALLLSDVVMPGMSGPELAQRVRARHAGIGVLLMSGYAYDALQNRDPPAGAVLAKPFTEEQLLEAVAGAVRGRVSR